MPRPRRRSRRLGQGPRRARGTAHGAHRQAASQAAPFLRAPGKPPRERSQTNLSRGLELGLNPRLPLAPSRRPRSRCPPAPRLKNPPPPPNRLLVTPGAVAAMLVAATSPFLPVAPWTTTVSPGRRPTAFVEASRVIVVVDGSSVTLTSAPVEVRTYRTSPSTTETVPAVPAAAPPPKPAERAGPGCTRGAPGARRAAAPVAPASARKREARAATPLPLPGGAVAFLQRGAAPEAPGDEEDRDQARGRDREADAAGGAVGRPVVVVARELGRLAAGRRGLGRRLAGHGLAARRFAGPVPLIRCRSCRCR